MAFEVYDNDPYTGYISWFGVHIVYKGVDYAIQNGYTNARYVYWLINNPYVFQASNTYPDITDDDAVVFLNKNGTHVTVPNSTVIDGSLIVPESILTQALSANCVTGEKILAGSISSDELAAGSVGAEKIAAGAVVADKIAAGTIDSNHINANGITANVITSGQLLTGQVEIVDENGYTKMTGDGMRVYDKNGSLAGHVGWYDSLGTQNATFTRGCDAFDSKGVQYTQNVPRYEYARNPAPIWQDFFDTNTLVEQFLIIIEPQIGMVYNFL
ncbi:hypothetical protein Dtox_1851 [Desulfofarcimen acetoxidans DSM 771]|uniref:Uncharacterized protein n=1 Tax=Desulfofarcimen acetoxidans (strain ATCC 49208 / DSM 771 / KCTC 5769 / VKM B-1644 / 5575) TaxID=485916 RepID=C8VXP2_DESAS|nr:hypothetical protein [Desulfofarcimen acetoxidans]ACV62698.1 hypothetical protein Dtox_1851 [Desulfofarcimen acetoxidans DSM 771]